MPVPRSPDQHSFKLLALVGLSLCLGMVASARPRLARTRPGATPKARSRPNLSPAKGMRPTTQPSGSIPMTLAEPRARDRQEGRPGRFRPRRPADPARLGWFTAEQRRRALRLSPRRRAGDLAVAGTRSRSRPGVAFWRIDPDSRRLTEVGTVPLSPSFGGADLMARVYKSPRDEAFYVFVTSKEGGVEQYRPIADGRHRSARPGSARLRVDSTAEGCVADFDLGGSTSPRRTSDLGIWAEPDSGSRAPGRPGRRARPGCRR